jgi:myo-inositol-1(or 4)-monophosphatase
MDNNVLQLARELSETIIRQAGQISRNKFDNFSDLITKGSYGDVVTEVDHLAEELIINQIQSTFPHHHIHSEEAGSIGPDSDWLWLIDPLDGTNNFAFVSVHGNGSFCNNRLMEVKGTSNLINGNIGWIQGYKVQNDSKAVRLRQYIDVNFKRMMRLWAPTLQWCMLAKGEIDGIILYNSEGDDLYSGILMVKEAGGIVIDFEGNPFSGMNEEPYIIACHPDHKQELIRIVREGLS